MYIKNKVIARELKKGFSKKKQVLYGTKYT